MTAQPDPDAWPVCPDHSVPYVLRRAHSWGTGGAKWVWMHDCTTASGQRRKACGQLAPILHNADGPIRTPMEERQ